MDCGSVANLLARYACIMNGTMVDELVGLGILGFIYVGGIIFMVRALVAGWNATQAE